MKSIFSILLAGRGLRRLVPGGKIPAILLLCLVSVCFSGTALGSGDEAAFVKSTRVLLLGETSVNVNIYEKPGAQVTFFAPHHDEQLGLNAAKEFIGKNGGRLVEIESLSENSQPRRYLYFKIGDKSFQVDPNRIYTANGRACTIPQEIDAVIKNFTDNLLQIIFGTDGKALRAGEKFLVVVHNNSDLSAKQRGANTSDLSAFGYVRGTDSQNIREGAFHDQAEGVYLSNIEPDPDNFVFLTTPKYLGYFAEQGFNVVVQKPAGKLITANCRIDDGSLSVYSGQNSIPYICLEADADFGGFRQKQMIQAVFDLLRREEREKDQPEAVAVEK